MPDNSRIDIRKPISVAEYEGEVHYLVQRFGITRDQARELIKHHGNQRETLTKYAKILVSASNPESARHRLSRGSPAA
jgi:Protein of unknown function (DUF3606)